jgi:hypothetical protein
MVTKAEISNNRVLSNNVGAFKDQFPNTRALVLAGPVDGVETLAVKDYYNIVILETDAALVSVPVPDFLVIGDESPYRNGVLYIDTFFGDENTAFCTNYNSITEYKKLKRPLEFFSSNFLKSTALSSTNPSTVRKTQSGLNQLEPGVHFALILGCTEIQYTGTSLNATTVGFAEIKAFTEERDRFAPKNLVAINRATVLTEFL